MLLLMLFWDCVLCLFSSEVDFGLQFSLDCSVSLLRPSFAIVFLSMLFIYFTSVLFFITLQENKVGRIQRWSPNLFPYAIIKLFRFCSFQFFWIFFYSILFWFSFFRMFSQFFIYYISILIYYLLLYSINIYLYTYKSITI